MIAAVKDNVSAPHPLATVAEPRLEASPYYSIRKVSCMYDEGVLVLRGRVPSSFHKQMAQIAVIKIQGIAQDVNHIEVLDPAT